MNTLEALNWRYATKQFDPNKKLTPEQLNTVLEALRLTPSSLGVQPWKFVVVENQQTKEALLEATRNQPQVVDCSHLIVIARKRTISHKDVDNYIAHVAKTRETGVEHLAGYKDMINSFIQKRTEEQLNEWMARQCYIALGNALTIAAIEGIDTCPMEGFIPKEYDRILELEKENLTAVVLLPLGFRSEEDSSALRAKVRYPQDDLVLKR